MGYVGKFPDELCQEVSITIVDVFKIDIVAGKVIEDAVADELLNELFAQVRLGQDFMGQLGTKVIIDKWPYCIALFLPQRNEGIQIGIAQDNALTGKAEGTR